MLCFGPAVATKKGFPRNQNSLLDIYLFSHRLHFITLEQEPTVPFLSGIPYAAPIPIFVSRIARLNESATLTIHFSKQLSQSNSTRISSFLYQNYTDSQTWACSFLDLLKGATATRASKMIDKDFVADFGGIRWGNFAASRIGGNEYTGKQVAVT